MGLPALRVRTVLRTVTLAVVLLPATGWSQTTIDRHVIAGGGVASTGGTFSLHGTIGEPAVGGASFAPYALTAGFWAGVTPVLCTLDVDGNGVVQVATDVVYIARHLLALTP